MPSHGFHEIRPEALAKRRHHQEFDLWKFAPKQRLGHAGNNEQSLRSPELPDQATHRPERKHGITQAVELQNGQTISTPPALRQEPKHRQRQSIDQESKPVHHASKVDRSSSK